MTTNEVVKATGLTPRMLQHWHETGLVAPVIERHSRDYSDEDLQLLQIVSQLKEVGISVQHARMVMPHVERHIKAHGIPRFIVGVDERVKCCNSPADAVATLIHMQKAKPFSEARVFVVDTEQP